MSHINLRVMKLLLKNRKEKGLTQQALADHFEYSSTQFISNIERGVSNLPAEIQKEYIEFIGGDPKKYKSAYVNDRADAFDEAML